MSNQHNEFLDAVKKNLDASVEHLDGATRSRLNRMRNQALSQQPGTVRTRLGRLRPAAALAALAVALLVAVGLTHWHASPPTAPRLVATNTAPELPDHSPPSQPSLPEDLDLDGLEILLDDASLDMLANLDFLNTTNAEEVGG